MRSTFAQLEVAVNVSKSRGWLIAKQSLRQLCPSFLDDFQKGRKMHFALSTAVHSRLGTGVTWKGTVERLPFNAGVEFCELDPVVATSTHEFHTALHCSFAAAYSRS